MKNKFRRFLAGLCTSMMLTQGIWDSGFVLYAAAGENVPVIEVASENDAEEVTGNEAADPDTEERKDTSDGVKAASENEAAKDDITDTSKEEEEIVNDGEEEEEEEDNGPFIHDGKIYTDSTKKSLVGTYNSSTGEVVIDAERDFVPCFVFNGWKGIKKLSFAPGSKAKLLGQNTEAVQGAFIDCTNLEEIDLTNATSLTTIKLNTFEGCISLKKVTFNEDLNFIESHAFLGCTSLEEIVFEKGLQKIGTEAFMNCENLHKITLKGVSAECEAAGTFAGCAIDSFVLAKDPKSNSAVFPESLFNGAKFKEDAVIEIDKDVVEICDSAFMNSNIAHVVLPGERLTAIGENAFYGCGDLAEIDFSACTRLAKIKAQAFMGCSALEKLVLPDNITFLGERAFAGCSGINTLTLTNGTQTEDNLEMAVFQGCESLEKVVFPDRHTYISDYEFSGCTSLMEVEFSSRIKDIGARAFEKCSMLGEVVFPDSLETMGEGAFNKCEFLYTVVFPEKKKFEVIPDNCFAECRILRYADLVEGIKEIGNNAFQWDNYYSSTLPSTLEYIGSNAFNTCGFSGELVLPEKLNYIGAGAFKSCRDHHNIKDGKTLSTIKICSKDLEYCGEEIFYECYVKEIVLPEGVDRIPADLFNQTTWETNTPIVIPNTVKTIGAGAFAGGIIGNVGNLKHVIFEEGSQLTEIEAGAFAYNTTLEEIELPATLDIIGKEAFADCTRLASIEIPENVTAIGESAFEGCSLLETVKFNAVAAEECDKNIFRNCNLKTVVFGKGITVFPDYLFYGAQFQKSESGKYFLVSLTVPATVKRIGEYCLTDVVNLEELTFESGSRLEEIGQYALAGCTGLKKIEFPASLKEINNYAFKECDKLTGIKLPKSLERVGDGAFWDCVAITEANIPAPVTEVCSDAFAGCKNLAKVVFEGEKVTSIGNGAFEECVKLDSITIPNSVEYIGICAFSGCELLATVNFDINGSLNIIEDEAFMGCPIGKLIEIPQNATVIGARAFYNAGKNETTKVYLPDSLNAIGDDAFNNTKPYIDNLEFYVVADSYAEEWLIENGFRDRIMDHTTKKDRFTVTFNLQGHGEDFEVRITEGDKVVRPVDPVEEGYDFGGWFTVESCKAGTEYNFETPVTKDITIYAKWDKKAEELKGGKSALDPTPEITVSTNELWLVKGQKFTIGDGWSVDKSVKKYVSISKKGVLTAKKETPAGVTVMITHSGREGITVHVSKPVIDKKLKLTVDSADQVKTGKISLIKDDNLKNVYWYSASPDVATVEQDGTVTAIGKGTAKVTAYINGCAYTCTVTVKENVALLNRTLHLNVDASKKISVKGVKTAWVSGSPEVATLIDKKGKKVKALTPGQAVLTTNANGSDYSITLYSEDIRIGGEGVVPGKPNKYVIELKAGDSTDLVFSDSLVQDVVFKSSKPDVAFVDENGHVVARRAGTSSLTTKINGKKITITVKVSE